MFEGLESKAKGFGRYVRFNGLLDLLKNDRKSNTQKHIVGREIRKKKTNQIWTISSVSSRY